MSCFPAFRGWRLFCAIALMALVSAFACAEGYPKVSVYAQGGIHYETRDLVGDFANFDFVAGCDFLIWDGFDLYLGPRVGLLSETVATANLAPELGVYWPLTLGGQLYFLIPSPFTRNLVVTCGAAFDILLYLDPLHWDPSDSQPTDFYTEVFLGLRYYLGMFFHVEARVGAGAMPFSSGPPIFIKGGIQASLDL